MKYITRSILTRKERAASDYIELENGYILSEKSYSIDTPFKYSGFSSNDAFLWDIDAVYVGEDEKGYTYYEYEA